MARGPPIGQRRHRELVGIGHAVPRIHGQVQKRRASRARVNSKIPSVPANSIASEYASSPRAQPTLQTQVWGAPRRSELKAARTSDSRTSQVSG